MPEPTTTVTSPAVPISSAKESTGEARVGHAATRLGASAADAASSACGTAR